jgi:hypothetical protein
VGGHHFQVDHISSRTSKKPPKRSEKGGFLEYVPEKRTEKGGDGGHGRGGDLMTKMNIEHRTSNIKF